MIHLDTSFVIRALVRESSESQRMVRWIRAGEGLLVSAVAWTEFLCGPLSPLAMEEAAELLGEPIAFDALDATFAAELFNGTGRRRGTLMDCMIAATAIRRDAPLATANPRDFHRFRAFGLVMA